MDLIKQIQARTSMVREEFDDPDFDDMSDLPDHILEELANDVKELLASQKFTKPLDAALYAVRVADLPGLEMEDDIHAAATKVLAFLRN